MSESQIKNFFKNQTIFLTGGSGFLGKVLIEKLLRECEDLKRIYILMRPKKGKTPEQRINELFSYACFERLKSTNPKSFQKVSLISGDCQLPFMGISPENIEILKKRTTCVIHAAANVKFEQPLKEATYNVRSTHDLLELSKQMFELKVFVYVSTAYSNCIYSHIKEEFYEPPMPAEDLIKFVANFDDDILETMTPKLLKEWPNTYVYTKCTAEDLIRRAGKDLPVTVVRPAIVCSTVEEPMPGWIDNFYGVVGIVAASALGVLRCILAKKDSVAHLIPVDYVSNCVLAAAWKREKSDSTTIYNYVGYKKYLITWRQFMEIIEKPCWEAGSEKVLWFYGLTLVENRTWFKINIFFKHTVVAHVVDFILKLLGKPILAVKNYERLNKMLDLLSYFSTRNWTFDEDNVDALWNEMNDEDRKIFNFNMEKLDITSYARDSVFGARLHLLKDTVDTIPKGNRKVKLLMVAHYTLIVFLWYLLYKLIALILNLLW